MSDPVFHIARCPVHGREPEEQERCRECDGPLERVAMVAADYFIDDELYWLEDAARKGSQDTIIEGAAPQLRALAAKITRLRDSSG